MDGGTAPAAVAEAVTDSVGVALPERVADAFARCAEFDELLGMLKQFRARLNKFLPADDAAMPIKSTGNEHVRAGEVTRDYKNLYQGIAFPRPFAVCPYCRGKGCKRGDGCRGLGWLTEASYKAVPNDLKAAMKGEAA
jgi:hypothetical protein